MATNYFLAGATEQERLRLQARTWEAETETMLGRIGIQPNWVCLDLGCGAMGILGPLSRQVGPDGRVVGIDTEPTLLAAARSYVQEEDLTNVEILDRDVNNPGLPYASFDFVHERLVFPHVAAPDALLREMIALTRPGGVIALQEGDKHSWNFFPLTSAWSRLKQIIETVLSLHTDTNLGTQTYNMLRRAGLENVTVRAATLALQDGHPYMQMPITLVKTMRKLIVGAGLATDMELDDLVANVEHSIHDPETIHITFTFLQVWGYKPRRERS